MKLLIDYMFSITRAIRENLLDQVVKCSLQLSASKDSEIPKATVETLPSTKTSPDSRLSGSFYWRNICNRK